MILSILISTIDTRINQVKDIILPARNDVNYFIIHQVTEDSLKDIPGELIRNDVKIYQIEGNGVNRSRNYAISQATGDIALMADDDGTYTNEYLDSIIRIFLDESPDIAVFKIRTFPGEPEYNKYPEEKCDVTLNGIHSINTKEITFKIEKIRNKIKFDERFGPGTFLIGGEEYFFITDAIKSGLKVKYYPNYIVNSSYFSTVRKLPEFHKKRIYAEGATYAGKFGWQGILRIFLKLFRILPLLIKAKKNPVLWLLQMYTGCFYILLNKKTV